MKAMRWHDKGDIRIDDVPQPQPGPDEVLIEVTFSGICGSEVHEYLAGPIFIPLEPHPITGTQAPQIMGHEFGGRIVELGSEVSDLKEGQIVTVNPILTCGKCVNCLSNLPNLCDKLAYYGLIGDGGHAEYAAVKAANCVTVPDDVPAEYVAWGEPAGVAFHAISRAAIKPESSVVVLGGGPIGQLAAQYSRCAGAEKVFLTEVAPKRAEWAMEIGAVDEVFNPVETDIIEEILSRTDGRGTDYAIECSGGSKAGLLEDTAAQAVELTRPEGTTVIVGTFAQPTEFHFNNIVLLERKVMGSWVWRSADEYRDAMAKIIEGKVKVLPLISDRIQLDNGVQDGIQALHLNRDEHMKILIDVRNGDQR